MKRLKPDFQRAIKNGPDALSTFLHENTVGSARLYPAIEIALNNDCYESARTLIEQFEPAEQADRASVRQFFTNLLQHKVRHGPESRGFNDCLRAAVDNETIPDPDLSDVLKEALLKDHDRIAETARSYADPDDFTTGDLDVLMDEGDFPELVVAVVKAGDRPVGELLKDALSRGRDETFEALLTYVDDHEHVDSSAEGAKMSDRARQFFEQLDEPWAVLESDRELARFVDHEPGLVEAILKADPDRTISTETFFGEAPDLTNASPELIQQIFAALDVRLGRGKYSTNPSSDTGVGTMIMTHPQADRGLFELFIDHTQDHNAFHPPEGALDTVDEQPGELTSIEVVQVLLERDFLAKPRALFEQCDIDRLFEGLTESARDQFLKSLDSGHDEVVARALRSGSFSDEARREALKQHLDKNRKPNPELLGVFRENDTVLKSDYTLGTVLKLDDTFYKQEYLTDFIDELAALGINFGEQPGFVEALRLNSRYGPLEHLRREYDVTVEIEEKNLLNVIEQGARELLRDALAKGAALSARHLYGATAQTDPEVLRMILDEYDSRVDVLTKAVNKVFQNEGPLSFIDILVEAGAGLNYDKNDHTVVEQALIGSDHSDTRALPPVERLLYLEDRGMDVTGPNGEAFATAVNCGRPGVLDYLLEQNRPDESERLQDLLVRAVNRGKRRCIEVLAEHGVDPSVNESKALFKAADQRPAIAETLVENGADIAARNQAILIGAAYQENKELLQWLVKQEGLELHERSFEPLYATLMGDDPDEAIVRMLLEHEPRTFVGHDALDSLIDRHDEAFDSEAPIASLLRRAARSAPGDYRFLGILLEQGVPLQANGGAFVEWVDEQDDRDLQDVIEPYRRERSQQARRVMDEQ